MPGSNSLARPRRVWRRYHQQEMHCNFTQYVLTTRQKYGCKQIRNTYVPSPIDTAAWKESGYLEAVWTRPAAIPDACLELVTCRCKSKCRTARCTCFKKDFRCTFACRCDTIDCSNQAGQYIHRLMQIHMYIFPLLL